MTLPTLPLLCRDGSCPSRGHCLRYTARPVARAMVYGEFACKRGRAKCEDFIQNALGWKHDQEYMRKVAKDSKNSRNERNKRRLGVTTVYPEDKAWPEPS